MSSETLIKQNYKYWNAPGQLLIVRIWNVLSTDMLLFFGSPTGDGGKFQHKCIVSEFLI